MVEWRIGANRTDSGQLRPQARPTNLMANSGRTATGQLRPKARSTPAFDFSATSAKRDRKTSAKPNPQPAAPALGGTAPQAQPKTPATPASAFNQALMGNTGLLGQARSFADTVGRLDLAGLTDQRYADLRKQGRGFLSQYEALDPSLAKGQGARGDLYATTGSTLTDALARLDDLRGQRQSESQRIQGFSRNLLGEVTSLRDDLGRVNYWDAGLDSYWDQINDLRGAARGFSSDLLGQVGFDPRIKSTLDAQASRVQALQAQRDAEQRRISGFERGLLNFGDTVSGQLDNLTIADVDQINALNRQLDARMGDARRFSSKLGFDLNDELYALGDADLRIDGLLSERRAEEERLRQARQGFSTRATQLQDMLADADIYDAGAFTDYERRLRDLRSEVSGFNSPLATGFDFSPQFSAAEARLGELRQEREAALSPYRTRLDTAASGIEGIDLWDEDALTARRRELDDLRGDTLDFTGGQMGDFRRRIAQSLDLVDDRLGELGEKRTGLNSEAEAMLRAVQGGSYYGADDITGRRTAATDMRATLDQWGVTGGMDEMDAIDAFLKSEEARLAQDASNVQSREAQAQAFARAMLGGQSMGTLMARRTLPDDQILALMQSMEDEDDAATRVARSSFSRSLGV